MAIFILLSLFELLMYRKLYFRWRWAPPIVAWDGPVAIRERCQLSAALIAIGSIGPRYGRIAREAPGPAPAHAWSGRWPRRASRCWRRNHNSNRPGRWPGYTQFSGTR